MLFSASFLTVWLYERTWLSALFFSASYALMGTGFGVEVLVKPHTDSVLLRVVFDAVYSLVGVAFLLGIQRRFKIRYTWVLCAVLFLAAWAGLSYYRFITPDLLMRARALTVGAGIVFAIASVQTFANGRSFADRVLFVFLALFALSISLCTFVTGGVDGRITSQNFVGSVTLAVINLLIASSALAVALTLLLDFVISAYKRMQAQSETDELTGLLNRRGFENGVETYLAHGSEASLILADIDYFKEINDKHGHLTGDEALRHFAGIFRTTVRQSDLSGRIGGEEFCALLPGATVQGAAGMAERIRERLRDQSMPNGCQMTVSFGVAQTQKGDDYAALFQRADKALYKAKKEGRNRVEIEG